LLKNTFRWCSLCPTASDRVDDAAIARFSRAKPTGRRSRRSPNAVRLRIDFDTNLPRFKNTCSSPRPCLIRDELASFRFELECGSDLFFAFFAAEIMV